MSGNASFGRQELISRLREYLGELSPDSHRTLSRSIDRARARGEHSPVHAIIMDAMRDIHGESLAATERMVSAERAFFAPLSPILNDMPLPEKHVGIVDRVSLRPIWIWITRDLAPGRCDEELAALRAAIVDEDLIAIEDAANDFQEAVSQHALDVMAQMDKQHGSLKRLEGQLGTSRVLADLHDIIGFFNQKPAFDAFLEQLPDKLPVGRDGLVLLNKALLAYVQRPPSDTVYAFKGVLPRLGAPGDLVRFAVHHADSTDPASIRASHAGGAMQIALSEAVREVETLRLALTQDRRPYAVTSALRSYHQLVTVIGRTLDGSANDPWLKRLGAIRTRASELLTKELEPLLYLIKRSISVMEGRNGNEIVPDRSSVEEAVFGVTLLMLARETRESLALNALIEKLERGIEEALESQGKQAIDRLSTATDSNWDAALARSEAAVKLFGIYFGGTYGASMARRHAANVEARALDEAS